MVTVKHPKPKMGVQKKNLGVKVHVKSHPGGKVKAASIKGKKASGMASSNFKKNIPVKSARNHTGGKTKQATEKNPFGHGEVIHHGFHGEA